MADYTSARARSGALTDQVAQAEAALVGARAEFRAGTRTIRDVLDAEAHRISAQIQLVRAERALHVAIFNLLRATGDLTPARLGLDVQRYDPSRATRPSTMRGSACRRRKPNSQRMTAAGRATAARQSASRAVHRADKPFFDARQGKPDTPGGEEAVRRKMTPYSNNGSTTLTLTTDPSGSEPFFDPDTDTILFTQSTPIDVELDPGLTGSRSQGSDLVHDDGGQVVVKGASPADLAFDAVQFQGYPGAFQTGDSVSETLFRTDAIDHTFGFGGADSIFAGAGADKLNGRPGSDTIEGQGGADTVLGRLGGSGARGPTVSSAAMPQI